MSSTTSSRVKYKIVKCTSEDPDYPVSELLAHSSQTKGWQTARFCDFPQEIGLMFETPVHLRQVQFLSHQSKIATKIELFTAMPPNGINCAYSDAQFKRLGYLSLDSNERSQFQARELKSVYVDVSALYLRIVLHKCHVNRYNIVNQVGLIALHCSGENLGPDLAVGPPPPNPTLARNAVADRRDSLPDSTRPPENMQAPAAAPAQRSPAPAPPAVAPVREEVRTTAPPPQQQRYAEPAERYAEPAEPPPPPVETQQPQAQRSASAASEDGFDARTNERIQQLNVAKQRAVEAEDYEEAKRCKAMLDRLRQTGQQLRDLEERKRAAVQNEDYDTATGLKAEIERLRSSAERPQQSPSSRSESRDRDDERGAPAQQQPAPRGGQQPVMAQSLGYDDSSAASGGGRRDQRGAQARASPEPAPHGSAPDLFSRGGASGPSPKFNPTYDEPEPSSYGPGPPMPFDDGGGSGGASMRRGDSPPLTGGGMQANAAAMGADDGGGGYSGGADNGFGGSGDGGRSVPSEAAHHLRGVPNVDDLLASPEPLSAVLEKEKECMLLVQLFGDYITRCIYSKVWSLRDAALQKLALDLREGARSGDEPNQLLQGYSAILKRAIADKNVQVSLSSGGLSQAVAQVLLEGGRIPRNEAQASLDPIMPLLVERLGEANARVDKTARDGLLDFARCSNVGALFASQYLLRSPKKKTGAAVHARVYMSRLHILTALATDFGVQPESKDGVPLEPTVKLAMESFGHKDGDVRDNSVKLVTACFLHVGLRRIEGYLANLRPAQREVFNAEFERASGGGGGGTPSSQGQPAQRVSPSSRAAPQRLDDPYGDASGGLPSPAVAPPRREAPRAAAPTSGGYQQEEANVEEEEVEDFTCQFCGRQDPGFTPEALDVHYWRECPMLIQCEFCQQVIEIATLRSHLCEECEAGASAENAGRDMPPYECPLCRSDLGQCEDRDWRNHLLGRGCTGNPRTAARGGSARSQR